MTAEKKTLFQFNHSPEWFETVLSSINEGVFCIDEEWRITCFNKAAELITGVSKEDALGQPCNKILRSNICKGACALRYTMETGRPLVNLSISITNTREEQVPISISTSLLKDKSGKIVGGVETFRDLSLVEQLRRELDAQYTFQDIVSKSPKMRHLFDVIPTIAESDSTVLISGASGTGKGLVAQAIHNMSHRRDGPFVTVNCSAFPDTLLESELFGYKAGAFTGARHDKPGRFALAEGGTIFLDEIGEVPPPIQIKLLRIIQDKEYEALGGVTTERADVRILSATNQELEELVKEGRFRTDLFYRINVIHLNLPSLKERKEDIPLLVDHFMARFASLKGKDIGGISPESLGQLMAHDYPGNVRELENIIEHAFVLCPGGVIQESHLPDHLRPTSGHIQSEGISLVRQYERELILKALERNRWNRLQAAKELGIHKTTLFRKIKRLKIKLPDTDGRSSRADS